MCLWSVAAVGLCLASFKGTAANDFKLITKELGYCVEK